MRDRLLKGLALCASAIFVAGCGASGPATTAPNTVLLTITAPSNGSDVGVHDIVVAGTVVPTNASVTVGGQPAEVVNGSFTRSMRLVGTTATITVTANAAGYKAASATTTVVYSATLAAQIAAGETAQQPQTVAVASTSTSSSTTTRKPASKLRSKPKATKPKSSTKKTASKKSGGSTKKPSSTTMTTAEIKATWLQQCEKSGKDQQYVPFCECTYTQLSTAGALGNRTQLLTLLRELSAYATSRNLANLPKAVVNAIGICVAKLPPLTPLNGKPVVTKLPGQTHGPSGGSTTTTGPAKQPTSTTTTTTTTTTTSTTTTTTSTT